MTSFFFKREKSPIETTINLSTQFVEPEADDIACLREVEVQRFKWNAFIKSRPNIWTENWLWQNWRNDCNKSGRPMKRIMQIFSPKMKAQKKLKKLIRAGVPPELRGSVWWACSGAAEKMKSAGPAEQYSALVESSSDLQSSQIASDIEKDLLRTFPERIKEENTRIVDMLRRMLLAYAVRNPSVGYCQSMNYICALLSFHLPEEQAFWLLATLLEDLLPSNYYSPSLLGGRVDQQVFQSCIAWKLPRLHSQFKKTSTLLEPIICPWFLCLYINVLPLYTVCRVWDCMFWEGSTVLFRIGLTLMKSKSRQICESSDFIGVYQVLKASGPNGANREFSFTLESAATTACHAHTQSALARTNSQNHMDASSPSPSPSRNSSCTASSPAPPSDASLAPVSDSQHLINSAFGYRWMRSVPRAKVEMLRLRFLKLLDRDSEEGRSSVTGPAKPTSPTSSASQPAIGSPSSRKPSAGVLKKTRKSMYILRVLDENDISALRDLALELDEGLGQHVEDFARELHTESTEDGSSMGGQSPHDSCSVLDDFCYDEEEEDEEEDDGDIGGLDSDLLDGER